MADIIVEDGSIVSGANSYVSEAELVSYLEDRDIILNGIPSAMLLQAMDYVETLDFIGIKRTENQPLQFPRDHVFIDGYYIEHDKIPFELKQGLMAVVVAIDEGVGPLRNIKRNIKRRKVGPIDVEYSSNSPSEEMATTYGRYLKKLLRNGGTSGLSFGVSRG